MRNFFTKKKRKLTYVFMFMFSYTYSAGDQVVTPQKAEGSHSSEVLTIEESHRRNVAALMVQKHVRGMLTRRALLIEKIRGFNGEFKEEGLTLKQLEVTLSDKIQKFQKEAQEKNEECEKRGLLKKRVSRYEVLRTTDGKLLSLSELRILIQSGVYQGDQVHGMEDELKELRELLATEVQKLWRERNGRKQAKAAQRAQQASSSTPGSYVDEAAWAVYSLIASASERLPLDLQGKLETMQEEVRKVSPVSVAARLEAKRESFNAGLEAKSESFNARLEVKSDKELKELLESFTGEMKEMVTALNASTAEEGRSQEVRVTRSSFGPLTNPAREGVGIWGHPVPTGTMGPAQSFAARGSAAGSSQLGTDSGQESEGWPAVTPTAKKLPGSIRNADRPSSPLLEENRSGFGWSTTESPFFSKRLNEEASRRLPGNEAGSGEPLGLEEAIRSPQPRNGTGRPAPFIAAGARNPLPGGGAGSPPAPVTRVGGPVSTARNGRGSLPPANGRGPLPPANGRGPLPPHQVQIQIPPSGQGVKFNKTVINALEDNNISKRATPIKTTPMLPITQTLTLAERGATEKMFARAPEFAFTPTEGKTGARNARARDTQSSRTPQKQPSPNNLKVPKRRSFNPADPVSEQKRHW